MEHLHEGEIPLPISSAFVINHHQHQHQHQHALSSTVTDDSNNSNSNSKKQLVVAGGGGGGNGSSCPSTRVIKYRECLKNHAAAMGGTATDGCGEFMPSGEEGSIEALKCSACGCHRNFHRKEADGASAAAADHDHHLYHHHYYKPRYLPPSAAAGRSQPPGPALIMPLGAIQTSESDEMEDVGHPFGFGVGGGRSAMAGSHVAVKKRFRTKFTAEQKEKMLGFAERVGWKLQRTEEGSVQQFCQEIGVKRRVLKVWMHNNKHHHLQQQHHHQLANNMMNATTNTSSNNNINNNVVATTSDSVPMTAAD